MDADTMWLSLGGTALHQTYHQAGAWRTRVLEAGTGEALILLHGTGGHAEAYARNIPALAERFRVIVPDLAGHGYTTLANADLEIDAYVEHLIALIDVLDIDRAHLGGESLGGWIAARTAAQHPDRVRRLVLNTPGGTLLAPAVMETIRRLSQEAADEPTTETIRRRLEWLMADPLSVTDELVEIRRRIYARAGFTDSMRHILCLQDPEIRRRNLLADLELASIEAPTLVVWTSDDPSGPQAAGQALAAAIPNAAFTVIDSAAHWPQWEQPATFNTMLLEFLSGSDHAPASIAATPATSTPSSGGAP